ncbi:hypothetical protein ACFLSW_00480 [Candidatus Bipolaricaulota bacterium]
MLDNYLRFGDAKIEIWYTEGEDSLARNCFTVLNAKLPHITAYFEVPGNLPRITVVLVPNRYEFDRLVCDLLGVEIEVPSHPARIAQPQRTDMVVLSPSAYEEHSIYPYVPNDFRRLLVHETVHMIEELLSPDIEASPRWWSEGLAVYLSEQCLHEAEFRDVALRGIADNVIPEFRDIEVETKLAYEWGWTIVQFVETKYGREMIPRIVRECADGNVFSFLAEDTRVLEESWKRWLADEDFSS